MEMTLTTTCHSRHASMVQDACGLHTRVPRNKPHCLLSGTNTRDPEEPHCPPPPPPQGCATLAQNGLCYKASKA